MVDLKTYNLMHPPEANTSAHEEFPNEAINDVAPPDGSFVLFLTPRIEALGFHNKKLVEVYVRYISSIRWSNDTYRYKLVLDEGKKELIKALIIGHLERSSSTKSDFLAGKGDGLLILLHGGPGTGKKTLTAESVAELAERPLHRLTCGDIGTDPETIEKYLNASDRNLIFNATQSSLVFLRTLEYYDGIFILTSNRIGTVDEAVKSRVQLTIQYATLVDKSRLETWKPFLTLLKEGGEDVDHDGIQKKLNFLKRQELNGRQIRNSLNAARQLAHFKKGSLGFRHIEKAIQNILEFETYVTNLQDGKRLAFGIVDHRP
ncbi:P-loop containing nucleoside triphosphate hydrolase protein [Macroventuria anomochaeta]|uniref:P-loop containing nucleoside triphosphate hydrolase protein n=1 Tax=Macroventuria anomochaeta TaxID=301207 RepID=A0ACB6S7N9_9PLEO|nr:P-loop containing nucleoside triphosphate hydrolase protein [Macroventuria anomochaeta]KAF2629152.1 P-loop containing nucleoside triphosphate hydrolase protein [Macroventuria anomochaeta]